MSSGLAEQREQFYLRVISPVKDLSIDMSHFESDSRLTHKLMGLYVGEWFLVSIICMPSNFGIL